jgi:23S rRNA (uracil-5-)-methyltransferase RumA
MIKVFCTMNEAWENEVRLTAMSKREKPKVFVHKPPPKGDATPSCPHFGICGGCTYQHERHETQLYRKKSEIQTLFRRAGLEHPELGVVSGVSDAYRNRMDFAFSRTLKGEFLGLREKNSFQHVIDIDECKISLPRVNELLSEVQAFRQKYKRYIDLFDIYKQEGTLKYATIRCAANTKSSSITFILNKESEHLANLQEAIAEFCEDTTAENVLIGWVDRKRDQSISDEIDVIKGERILEESLTGKTVRFDSQSFFQNHTAMIEKIITTLRAWITEKNQNHFLLDLYGGAGTFAVTLGDLFKGVSVVDIQGANIEQAKYNLEAAGFTNAKALSADALDFTKVVEPDQSLSTFLLDPPRAGLHPKVLDKVLSVLPKTIYYVSCNPKQFVAELPAFQKHYTLTKCSMFDLFPQTPHLELVSELVRID